MSEDELVKVEDAGSVRTLWMNRPERRNALSGELVAALSGALVAAEADPRVHVIVLAGAGKSFCAGGDLGPGAAAGALALHRARRSYADTLCALLECSKPTIARVHGDALGGGFGLVLACDLVVASSAARLGTPEVRLGLFPMMIMPLIVHHLGRRRAAELILTGGRLQADDPLLAPALNRVVPPEAIDEALEALVDRLTSFSPAVHALGLQMFRRLEVPALQSAIRSGASELGVNLMLEDAAEGIAAFLTKRPPEWKGR